MKVIALLPLAVVAGCTDLLALDGHRCPCARGYTCQVGSQRCVLDGNAPAPDMPVGASPYGDAGTLGDGPASGGWGSPTEIATNALGPRLFSDRDGNVLLTWRLVGPVGLAQRWTPATGWSSAGSTPVAFTDVGTGRGGNAIGVGGAGVPTGGPGDPTGHVQASLYFPGSGWSAVQQVDTETLPAYVPSVRCGMDGAGNALVVFRVVCFSCTTSEIKSRLYTPATGWGPIMPVSGTGGSVFLVAMAMADNGTAVVAYGKDDEVADASNLWVSRYTPSQGWAAPQQFAARGDGGDTAIDGAGNAMVVWRDYTARAIFVSRNTGSGWSTAVPLSVTAFAPGPPILAMNSAGDAVAAWNTVEGSLYATRFSGASGTWSTVPISPAATSPTSGNVALDGAGNALLIWEDLDTPVHVWASRLPAGATAWSSEVRLDTAASITGDADDRMSAACVPTGTCFGAWSQYDTSVRKGLDHLYLSMRP